jgi:hypothetical protein
MAVVKDEWITLDPVEKSRIYAFPQGTAVFTNVTRIKVSSHGTHYIECNEGKIIVPPRWNYIKLDVETWTTN